MSGKRPLVIRSVARVVPSVVCPEAGLVHFWSTRAAIYMFHVKHFRDFGPSGRGESAVPCAIGRREGVAASERGACGALAGPVKTSLLARAARRQRSGVTERNGKINFLLEDDRGGR